MRTDYQICSSCGRLFYVNCQRCRTRWARWMRVREQMGGYREGTFISSMPLPPRRLTVKEAKRLSAWRELVTAIVKALDVACGVDRDHAPVEWERCSGNTPIWKDDESGASSGWDTVVRLYEDNRD